MKLSTENLKRNIEITFGYAPALKMKLKCSCN